MKSIAISIIRSIFSTFPYFLFIYFYLFSNKRNGIHKDRQTLIFLTPFRFRGDIEILERTGKYNIVTVDLRWLQLLTRIYYGSYPSIFFGNNIEKDTIVKRKKYRKDLSKGFVAYCKYIDAQAVFSASVYYRWEYDIGHIFNQHCGPWIALHRENMYASKGFYAFGVELYKNKGNWKGAHVIVHNHTTKDILIESNFALDSQVSVLGALRMEGLISELQKNSLKKKDNKMKTVLFFSFAPGSSLYGYKTDPTKLNVTELFWPKSHIDSMWDFFVNSHVAAIRAASEGGHKLIIRPKWGGRWTTEIEKVIDSCKSEGINVSNIEVDLSSDSHQLILSADVIIGFATTALLEAALTNKQVIVPNFNEASDEKFGDYIILKDTYDSFTIANSEQELINIIKGPIEKFKIDSNVINKRKEYFEKWVAPIGRQISKDYI